MKHRHKHETEIKTLENLLEKSGDTKKEAVKEIAKPVDKVDGKTENNVPMDIDDIPIPEEITSTKKEEDINLKSVPLPNHTTNNIKPPPLPNETTEHPPKPKEENRHPKKVTKLPLPPGMNQTDLEDIQSPPSRSPTPQPPPPLPPPRTPPRKGIMNLPMPPVVPGTEELSGDEEGAGTPPRLPKRGGDERRGGAGPRPKLKRPKILKKGGARGGHQREGKEWGERCVDVFEVIAQIGEGM